MVTPANIPSQWLFGTKALLRSQQKTLLLPPHPHRGINLLKGQLSPAERTGQPGVPRAGKRLACCFQKVMETGKWGRRREEGSSKITALHTDGTPKANREAPHSLDLALLATCCCMTWAKFLRFSELLGLISYNFMTSTPLNLQSECPEMGFHCACCG